MHNIFSCLELGIPQLIFRKSGGVRKLFSILLIAFFIFPPQLLVAQESGEPAAATPEESAITDTPDAEVTNPLIEELFSPEDNTDSLPIIEDPTDTDVPSETPLEEETLTEEDNGDEPPPPSLLDSEGDPIPTISNTNLFSYQSNIPKVDDSTGALVERVAFEVPPGRNNLTPDVGLTYNSQELMDNIVGYGWTLSIPYIERLNKTGSENLYIDNYFTSSLGGELATTTTANEYRQRIEDGRFIAYTFSNKIWTAYDKNGTRYLFGTTTAAQQSATTSPSNVFKWMLEEVRDTNNNYIRFEYQKNDNQIYPSTISYTGNGVSDGIFDIDFTYATRTDPVISYKSGFKVTTNRRLTEVKASVNDSWVRKYTLSYRAGVNSTRSLLSGVQETGRDDQSTELALPSLTFGYSSSSPSYVSHTNRQIYNAARVAADVNGNGLPDMHILKLDNCGGGEAVRDYSTVNAYPTFTDGETCPFITAGDYWSQASSWDELYFPVEFGVRMFDVNGDGMADIVRGYNTSGGTTLRRYYERSGGVWSENTTSTTTIPMFAYNNGSAYSSGLLGNLNGDGLIDYVLSLPGLGSNQSSNGAYLHAGTAGSVWVATSTFGLIADMPTDPLSASANELVDINGDGLDDWMKSTGGTTSFCLNTGTSWDSSCVSPWTIATSTRHANGWDRGIRFVDVNGDGLLDYVRAYTMPSYSTHTTASDIEVGSWNYAYLNTGSGWATSTLTAPAYIFTGHPVTDNWTGHIEYNEFADWNGDGIPDQANHTSTSTASLAMQDILNQIVYPTTGTTTVEYKLTSQLATENSSLPFPILVVTRTSDQDGMGHTKITDFSYEGGKMYLAGNIRDRRFANFKTITKTDPLNITRVYFNQGDGTDTALGEQSDSFAQIGKPYREDVISLASTTMRQTFNKWTAFDQGNAGRNFVYLEKQLVENYDGNSDHWDSATEYTYATTTGDLTQLVQRGEVAGSSDGTYTDVASDTVTKAITYAASSTVNMSVPIQETITNSSDTRVKESKFYYDTLASGSVNKGNLTKKEDWITSTTYASTTMAYNAYGLIATSTDPRSKSTIFGYDSYNLYVASSSNALGHVSTTTYDYATGKPIRTTDPNGRMQQFIYDPVGRLTEKKVPDPASGSLVTQSTIAYTDNAFPSSAQFSQNLNSATSTELYRYFDGFGRLIQDRKESSTYYVVADTVYGTNARISVTTLPYFSSGSSRTTATTTESLFVTYTYDALGRVTSITNSEGAEVHSFDQWVESVTDRNGNVKDLTQDAFGNLHSVDEHNATSTLSYSDGGSSMALARVQTVHLGKATAGRIVVAVFNEEEEPAQATPKKSIHDMLEGKSSSEKAEIKADQILQFDYEGSYIRDGITLEIIRVEKIPGGIQVLSRAWKDGVQLGFGSDGTVDIERFRFFNPPVLVPDGTTKKVKITHPSGRPELAKEVELDNMKEDPKEALLQSLAQAAGKVGKIGTTIEEGKVGHTTDTYYPDAGTGVTAMDAVLYKEDNSFATARSASAATVVSDTSTVFWAGNDQNSGGLNMIERVVASWDTTALPDTDSISSATLSCYGNFKSSSNPSYTVNIYDATPADPGSIVTDDYDQTGGISSPTTYSSVITNTNWSTSAYNDFALNGSGIANINVSGVSSFSMRNVEEVGNTEPGTNTETEFGCRSADQTGTTQDPKLVVVHSSNSAPSEPTSVLIEGTANPTAVSDATPEFSAIYNDPDATDVAASYQIQVASTSSFTSPHWDSGKTALASSTPQGTRIADISYGGGALASSTIYYMRIKFWDTPDVAGAWSATSTFMLGIPRGTTEYTYDALNNLTKITDVMGNVRNFTYDGLSRLTASEDLHVSADGTFGSYSYTYDIANNLTQKVDPKSQTINYTFDGINRVLTEDYTGSAGTEVAYEYDTCTDGRGRLCIATTTDAVSTYAYNPLGLPSSEIKRADATNYTTSYSYDRQGNQTDITYPDASAVRYMYDDAGLLQKVARKPGNSSTYANAMIAMTYAPTGAVASKLYGNGVTSTYTYDPTILYRLSNILTLASSTWSGGGSLAMRSNVNGPHFALNPSVPRPLAVATPQFLTVAEFGAEVTSDEPVTTASSSVSAMLEGKSSAEKADIKAAEIVKQNLPGIYQENGLTIEIESIEQIRGGIQLFARAWKAGDQLGFGKDGSVEIERFRIFNPPILVPDGTQKKVTVDHPTGRTELAKEVLLDNMKEDLREALISVLSETIERVGKDGKNIERGKIGHTTDTYYPNPGIGVTAEDAFFYEENFDFATARAASVASAISDAGTTLYAGNDQNVGGLNMLYRAIMSWDTASLPDADSISSATLSCYGMGKSSSNPSYSVNIYTATPANAGTLTTDDFDQTGGLSSPTTYSSAISNTSWSTSAYNDFVLNASGIAHITKTGVSSFSMRNLEEIAGTEPASNTETEFGCRDSDQTGTTEDPKLVIVHTGPGTGGLQNITYAYDAVGNIVHMDDNSTTDTNKDVLFTYDNLSRLWSASTTEASTTPYRYQFAYNALGNILGVATSTQTGTTTYAYAGTSYANPHAATSIGATTYTYDNNGNLTSAGRWTYGYDHRNRLTSVGNGVSTTTFGYDHNNERVFKHLGNATTTYPNMYFNTFQTTIGATTTATTTIHLFTNDGSPIATVEGNGSATTTAYIHTDHLGGASVISNSTGNLIETADYYPYGAQRIHTTVGTFSEQKKFTGYEYDVDSDLSYAKQRYYDQNIGRFLTEDPVFTADPRQQQLSNPQTLNSYSYANGNPINAYDPTGTTVELISRPLIQQGGGWFAHSFVKVTATNPNSIGALNDVNHATGEMQNINTSAPFTLSGFTDGAVLFKEANAADDYARMSGTCDGCSSIIVSPPNGVTDEEFERRIVQGFGSLTEDINSNYGRTGQVSLTGDPNSNNAATTFLMSGGVTRSQVNAYQSALYASNKLYTPGLGQSALSPSYFQSAANGLSSLLGKLGSLLKQISDTLPKSN